MKQNFKIMDKKKKQMRLSEQLKTKIEEFIATGVYSPGMKLDETELADSFGVSRTPVREALIKLSSAGLVELRPRRGAVVTSIDPTRLFEMFEVMAELEAICAKLAARRITDAELQRLINTHKACEKKDIITNPDEYYKKNEEFHLALYNACHNSFLIEQAIALHKRLSPYRRLQLRVRDRIQSSLSEHKAILDAIASGDAEKAAEMARGHILVQGERFSDLLATLKTLGSPIT